MIRARRAVPLLVLALVAALALGLAGLTAAPAQAAREPLIQGVAVDGRGRPLLDVTVIAVGEDGQAAASDLSYENTAADGSPQPGYFALHVGADGIYTVTLKKKGFEPQRLSGIEIRRGAKVASLGDIHLARSTTTAARVLGDVRVGEKARVKVTVDPTGLKPTGSVRIRHRGRTVGWGDLKGAHKGVITVTLVKLPKGTYGLRAVYGGSTTFATSTSGKVTLTVKPPRKKDRRRQARTCLA